MFVFYGKALFYLGVGIMTVAVLFALVGIVVYCVAGKKLGRKLEQEYGKKRH